MDNSIIIAIIGGLLGGSTVAALINQIGEGVRQRRKRKYEIDGTEQADIIALKSALKWVLYDRVRYLGIEYISEGSIDFDDRRILNEIHSCYHNSLGGNGDLNNLMKAVNDLPLKKYPSDTPIRKTQTK